MPSLWGLERSSDSNQKCGHKSCCFYRLENETDWRCAQCEQQDARPENPDAQFLSCGHWRGLANSDGSCTLCPTPEAETRAEAMDCEHPTFFAKAADGQITGCYKCDVEREDDELEAEREANGREQDEALAFALRVAKERKDERERKEALILKDCSHHTKAYYWANMDWHCRVCEADGPDPRSNTILACGHELLCAYTHNGQPRCFKCDMERDDAEMARLQAIKLKKKFAPKRPSWAQTGLAIATVISARSTCPRLAVGAVALAEDHRILAAAYNGAPRSRPHCTTDGCIMEDGHCIRAIHAEANLLIAGVNLRGSTLCLTHAPCRRCLLLMDGAGVAQIFYAAAYGDPPPLSYGGILIAQLDA